MNFKTIRWNEVNRFSQLIAIILFVGVFILGFLLGVKYEYHAFVNAQNSVPKAKQILAGLPIDDARYSCDNGKEFTVIYFEESVQITLPDTEVLKLTQVEASTGLKYADYQKATVFVNTGKNAFITVGDRETFANCTTKPIPKVVKP